MYKIKSLSKFILYCLTIEDITWITTVFYQTHRLSNNGNKTAETIQAYVHTDANTDFSKSEYPIA